MADIETTVTAVVNYTQDNSSREGQQLQAAMEHIMTLTDQNMSLQTECYQLMAANTELFQKSVVLQYECSNYNYKLDAKSKKLKTSMMCQALKKIRKETFSYANIKKTMKKPVIILAYTYLFCI